ncbi:putative sulfate exporter family transporter [Maribrevibacterium harenarium]|uniref:Putative sulfate exporter family transporter n=1 Tax=Maribrevibacterium harenarium TaxID=2589817 RepID=A0A501WRS2_9GAMM|nr:putative sulfate exporter family transporter [Maribrevibacterium harenarium]TPE51532.1 putative sulfate exporter family transporter [Maribrevibacterium harenarium]
MFNPIGFFAPKIRGVMLAAMMGLSAAFLSEHYGAPVMLMALLLGMSFNFMSESEATVKGVEFSATTILRVGVALLGARITFGSLTDFGVPILVATATLVVAVILLGVVLGRLMKLPANMGLLGGCAVAICGASATAAVAAILPKSQDADRSVVFTIVGITAMSTTAMIFYPMLANWLGMDERAIGYFLGATIHDVAQVVGAGYGVSEYAGDTATVIKLFRVAMLAPIVFFLALFFARHQYESRATRTFPIPGFLVVFILLMLANTMGLITQDLSEMVASLSRWCLIVAIAAIGMRTQLNKLRKVGMAAILLLVIETIFMAVCGSALALMFL